MCGACVRAEAQFASRQAHVSRAFVSIVIMLSGDCTKSHITHLSLFGD